MPTTRESYGSGSDVSKPMAARSFSNSQLGGVVCDRCGSTLSHAYNLSRHYQTKKCIKFSAEPGAAPAGKQPIAAAAANNQNSLKDCTSKKPCPHCMKNIFKSNMARHLKSCKVYLSKGIDIPLTPSNRSGNTDVANPVSPPPEHSADGNIVTAETMEHCSQQVLHANDDKPDQDLPNNKLYLPRSSLAWAKADQQLEQHIKRHFPLSKIKNEHWPAPALKSFLAFTAFAQPQALAHSGIRFLFLFLFSFYFLRHCLKNSRDGFLPTSF